MKEALIVVGVLAGVAVSTLAGLRATRIVVDKLTRRRDEDVWWGELQRRRAVYCEGMAVADHRYKAIPGHEAREVAEQVRRLHRRAHKKAVPDVRPFPRRIA